jgi:hypothetical protein
MRMRSRSECKVKIPRRVSKGSASAEMAAKRTSGNDPPDCFRSADDGGSREADARKQSEQGPRPADGCWSRTDVISQRLSTQTVSRGKVTRSWRVVFSEGTCSSALIAVPSTSSVVWR